MSKLCLMEATANDGSGGAPLGRRIAALEALDPKGSVLVEAAAKGVGLYWRNGSNESLVTSIAASIPDELAIRALVESGERTAGEAKTLWREVRRRSALRREDRSSTGGRTTC